MQGVRRQWHLRARASAGAVHGVRRQWHLRARASARSSPLESDYLNNRTQVDCFSQTPVLADATAAALRALRPQTPVLADATAAALLALRPPTPVLADATPARRVAVRAHPTYFAVLARFFEIRSEPGCF